MGIIAKTRTGVQHAAGLLLMVGLTVGLMLGLVSEPAAAAPAPSPSGSLQFVAGSLTVVEGDLATLDIERVGGSSGVIQLTLQTVDGSATAGDDYAGLAAPLLLTWADGEVGVKQLALPTVSDVLAEGDETFTVELSSANAGALTVATVTIEDVPNGVLQFVAGSVTVVEGGSATLQVERVGGSFGQITASVQTMDGTATNGLDYAGIPVPLTLTWLSGETAPKTIMLPVQSDIVAEGDETFTAEITSSHGGSPTTATVTITDVPTGVIQFAADSITVAEGGSATLELLRVGGSHGQITAAIQTFDGTATSGADYAGIAVPLTLTWPNGDTSPRTIMLPVLPDAVAEGDETFTAVITSMHAGTPTMATVTITGTLPPSPTPSATPTAGPTPSATPDPMATPPATPTVVPSATPDPMATPDVMPSATPDPVSTPDPAPTSSAVPVPRPAGIIEFVQAGYTVTEAECVVAVELQRVQGRHGEVTVTVGTSAGSALANQDYVPIKAANPVQVTWADGDTANKVVLVKLVNDGQPEPDESFNVVLLKTVGAGQGRSAVSIVITETPVAGADAKPVTTGCVTDDTKADTTPAVGVSRRVAAVASPTVATTSGEGAAPVSRALAVGGAIAAFAAAKVGARRFRRSGPVTF